MTKRPKLIAAIGVSIAAVLTLSACTPGVSQPGASGAPAGSTNNTLANVLQSGTVRVADCLSFAPFGFVDQNGAPAGYDVDIANALAADLGVKAVVTDTTAANRIANLQTNKVDIVFCNFTITGDRANQIEFTNPYVVATEALLVKKDSGINSVADMTGKSVATVKGSTNGDDVTAVNPQAKIQQYDSSAAAILAVQQGQADAMVEDSNFLAYQAALDPSLEVTSDQLVPLEYNGFGVRQGDQIWLNRVNDFLFRFNASGQNEQLYEKWFNTKPKYPLQPQY